MKNISLPLALFLNLVQSVNIEALPDVFGPNGKDYQNNNAALENADFGIDIIKKGDTKSDTCNTGQWATVHWTGKLKNGRVVTDSRAENSQSLPKTFNVGSGDMFKCWELAIQQLHPGAKAKIHCPAYQVWGSAEIQAPVGDGYIPKNSDIDFDFEVVDCNVAPKRSDPTKFLQPKTTTMQPDSCMYLHLIESDSTGIDLVLSTQPDNVSDEFPGKWAMLEEFVRDDDAQSWFYNAQDGSLSNRANPDYKLDTQNGWLYVADMSCKQKPKDFPQTPRKWFYESGGALTTVTDGVKTMAGIWGQPRPWAMAENGPYEALSGGPSGKWKIEYCYLR